MNLKNMRECDNSKIHVSNNALLTICLLIMLDTLLLVPSLHFELHCNSLKNVCTNACDRSNIHSKLVACTIKNTFGEAEKAKPKL